MMPVISSFAELVGNRATKRRVIIKQAHQNRRDAFSFSINNLPLVDTWWRHWCWPDLTIQDSWKLANPAGLGFCYGQWVIISRNKTVAPYRGKCLAALDGHVCRMKRSRESKRKAKRKENHGSKAKLLCWNALWLWRIGCLAVDSRPFPSIGRWAIYRSTLTRP